MIILNIWRIIVIFTFIVAGLGYADREESAAFVLCMLGASYFVEKLLASKD